MVRSLRLVYADRKEDLACNCRLNLGQRNESNTVENGGLKGLGDSLGRSVRSRLPQLAPASDDGRRRVHTAPCPLRRHFSDSFGLLYSTFFLICQGPSSDLRRLITSMADFEDDSRNLIRKVLGPVKQSFVDLSDEFSRIVLELSHRRDESSE